jgi:hypothetical protein
MTEPEEQVVNVHPVGVEWGLTGTNPAEDRKHHVEQRQSEHEQGQHDRPESGQRLALSADRVDLPGHSDSCRSKQQAQQHGSRIAHENRGWVPVIRQEPDAHPHQ